MCWLHPVCACAAIVGSLGTLQLGAAGLSNLVFFFCTVLFSFLLAVTTPRVAAATAENRGGEVGPCSCSAMLICIQPPNVLSSAHVLNMPADKLVQA